MRLRLTGFNKLLFVVAFALHRACVASLPRPRLYAIRRQGTSSTARVVMKRQNSSPLDETPTLSSLSLPSRRALVGIRGGATSADNGPLITKCTFDTSWIAKAILAHHVLFGLSSWLAPSSMMALFHDDSKVQSDKEIHSVVGRCGTVTLSAAVLLYCTVIQNMDVVKAGGYSIIPWLLAFTYSLLPEARRVNQMPLWILAVFIPFGTIIVYGCLSDASWGKLMLQIYAAGALSDFVSLTFFTKAIVMSVWQPNRKDEPSKTALQYWRWFGILIGMYTAHLWSLLIGIDPIKAVGASQVPLLVIQVLDMILGVADKAPNVKGHLMLVALSAVVLFGCAKGPVAAAAAAVPDEAPPPPIEDIPDTVEEAVEQSVE